MNGNEREPSAGMYESDVSPVSLSSLDFEVKTQPNLFFPYIQEVVSVTYFFFKDIRVHELLTRFLIARWISRGLA